MIMQTLSRFSIMRRLPVICLLCALCLHGQAQDAAQLFGQANELFAAANYAEAIELIQKNEHVFAQERELDRMFTFLSWFCLFNKDFDLAEQTVRKAIEHDGRLIRIRTYLAHALLFQGKTAEAETVYGELTRTVSWDLNTYSSDILTEFAIFEKAGIIPPAVAGDYERIKATVIRVDEAVRLFNLQFHDLCLVGEYDEAIALITPYLSILTDKHIEGIAFWLGAAFYGSYEEGDYPQAEKYCREAQHILEQTVGKEHPDYARSLTNSGFVYHSLRDFEQAENCFLEAGQLLEKVLGRESREYATALHSLGVLYADFDRYGQAETCFLEAKAIRERILQKNHDHYFDSLYDLALFYFNRGDYEQAEKYMLEEKSILDEELATENPGYASLLNRLGSLYYAAGDREQAEKYWLEAKALWENIFGENLSKYEETVNNLKLLYQE